MAETMGCEIKWYHTDHYWTDKQGNSYRCPGIWPPPRPVKKDEDDD